MIKDDIIYDKEKYLIKFVSNIKLKFLIAI